MKKILTITLLLFFAEQANAQLKWRIIDKPMPYPVFGGQIVYDIAALSNKIYILGGFSELQQREVDWIQEYDVVQNTWRIVGNMKQIRMDFVGDIWRNKIVYFGGVTESSVDKYTIESWNFKPEASPPEVFDRNSNFGRSLSTGHVAGDRLYIIGGDSLNYGGSAEFPYIVEYNLLTKQTEIIAKINSSKDKPRQHMTFMVGDNIYIFGGVFNGVKKSIRKFNIPSRNFTDLTEPLIEARAGGAAVYNPIIQKGYIIGGYNETNSALNSVEEVIIQPDGSLKIASSTSLNYARTNLMAVNYKGTVAVFGGKDPSGRVVPFVEISEIVVDAEQSKAIPTEHLLFQNYPNPFNPSTTISYQISAGSFVQLKIYDVLGKEIITLVNQEQQPGYYTVEFDAQKTTYNGQLPSGIYFYSLTVNGKAGNYFSTKKMLLLK